MARTAEHPPQGAFLGGGGSDLQGSQAFGIQGSLDPEIVLENRFGRAQRRISEALVSRGTHLVPDDLKRRIEILARRWAAEDFDDGFEQAEEFEIESARERERILAERSGRPEEVLAVAERAHRRWIIETYGSIELRGLQLSERVYQSLEVALEALRNSAQDRETLRNLGSAAKLSSVESVSETAKKLLESQSG